MLTVAPASAVPLRVGLASLVSWPLVRVVTAPTSSTTETSTGTAGGWVSTVRLKVLDGSLTLPAASVANAVKLCVALVSGVVRAIDQLPLASAVAVPSRISPSNTCTRAFASLVPVSTGRVSSVRCPLGSAPVMLPTSSWARAITGASGLTVSTITVNPAEASLRLPAASVALAVKVWLPLPSAVAGVKLHSPAALACTVPRATPLS